MEKEVSQVLFLRARENEGRLGVEFLCGDHGGEGIKVGIRVGRNDLLINLFQKNFPFAALV